MIQTKTNRNGQKEEEVNNIITDSEIKRHGYRAQDSERKKDTQRQCGSMTEKDERPTNKSL